MADMFRDVPAVRVAGRLIMMAIPGYVSDVLSAEHCLARTFPEEPEA